ncbi:aminopeptidase P family protein [Candidatus Poribacteria bacterium]|nr:aminopeptidase P family protein [Candidatus Poribacteria bacterium]
MINKSRIKKAQDRMKQQGIDAYLILTHDDYIYFFGEDRYQPRAVIPAQGMPIIVTFSGEEEEVRKSLGVEDVRIFGSVGQQIKDVVQIMRGMVGDKDKLKIGVQMWFGTPAFLLNMFQKANPIVDVVDIASVMDDLRMVKDENEIKLIQHAADIAVIGMKTAVKTLKAGITENDVAAEVEYAMRKAGGHGVATPVYVNSGIRSGWLHGTASDKIIEHGDLVVLDLVPRYKGYCANLCRTFVIGKPNNKHIDMYETYKEAQSAAINVLRPGKKIREIDAVAKSVYTENGYEEFYVAGIGHSIGLSFEETPAPTIHPGDSGITLCENMVMTVGHPVLSVPGTGGVRLEDTFHIKSNETIPITEFPSELELNHN